MAVEQFPAFLQNETYSAALVRRAMYVHLLRGATVGSVAGGVVGGSDCVVTQNGTPNMSVNIAVGEMIVPGSSNATQSGYYLYVSSTTNVAVGTAPSSNSRIDLACGTVSDTSFGGSDAGTVQVVAGLVSGSPVAPSLPTTSVPLADIAVGTSVSSIVTANITDARTFVVTGLGLWNTRRVSGSGTINALHGDHIVVTSGSTPIVLPAMAANARCKQSNQGSGVPTVTQHASEKIFGAGLGSTGSTTFSLGSPGATATEDGDGVAWTITAGNADSGWIKLSTLTYQNGWGDNSGPVAGAAAYRKIANVVRVAGSVTGGASGTAVNTTALASAFQPSEAIGAFPTASIGTSPAAAYLQVTSGSLVLIHPGANPILLDGITWLTD